MKSFICLILLASACFAQLALPAATDPWWKTEDGKAFRKQLEAEAEKLTHCEGDKRTFWRGDDEGFSWCSGGTWHGFKIPGCLVPVQRTWSDKIDGLPPCPMPNMKPAECLHDFPPDIVGGFCRWFGFANRNDEEKFERKRGFVRSITGGAEFWRRLK